MKRWIVIPVALAVGLMVVWVCIGLLSPVAEAGAQKIARAELQQYIANKGLGGSAVQAEVTFDDDRYWWVCDYTIKSSPEHKVIIYVGGRLGVVSELHRMTGDQPPAHER